MASAHVEVIRSVNHDFGNGYQLNFQWCEYQYDDGSPPERGYRFIWQVNGALKPTRGQALIPSAEIMFSLIARASSEGWFVACESD